MALDVNLGGITFGPVSCDTIMFITMLQVLCGNAAHQWIGRVTVGQEGADGKQHFRDGQCGTPVILQNVKTDHTLAVYIAMVNSCSKGNFRWLKRVVRGKVNVEKEDPTLVDRAWRTENGGDPFVQIVAFWASAIAVNRNVN